MLTKESLTAVTTCILCGSEMSTSVKCDECGKRMCMVCGQKHKCKGKKEKSGGKLHP